ncbi:porin family protein [Acidicapsa dinghuensis]|uniref:Porin family protein n=1 Tax=Acidicapsa dinghuensis TaxID=2218256 RepID=A0ABW1EL88_9BACT|nr:porin family protein [Acidicapsa dinghuensis]
MRLKFFCVAAAVSLFSGLGCHVGMAQVAPAARVSGIPLTVSIGISDYDLDYGPGRRMQGVDGRIGYEIFRGIGIDGNARTIFMNTPYPLTRMQQTTYLGGIFYEPQTRWRFRPFVRMGGGIGVIEFPSRNPFYTRDSYSVYAPSGGVEIPVMARLAIRGEYEYQFWKQYQGPNDLTPQGFTIGVTYAIGGRHLRVHGNH